MRILILEDDPFIATDLEMLVDDIAGAVSVVSASIAGARVAIADELAFAILDVDLVDGKSFEIADALTAQATPFVFVSGSPREQMPERLRAAPFIAKPFRLYELQAAMRAAGIG
ncbi:response regulator [Methylobrevis albus]|uniref:Response regulator n=1 Tax=Methylobrevis albus TaxID=2793297 RepID=A0A931HYN0_9HYPH|nr:response regulator [Methylobrevis albus]MBH0236322.1 response regulator [Methylobrevis albus]